MKWKSSSIKTGHYVKDNIDDGGGKQANSWNKFSWGGSDSSSSSPSSVCPSGIRLCIRCLCLR